MMYRDAFDMTVGPYIPAEHEGYGLLPRRREEGGEVFTYPAELDAVEDMLREAEGTVDGEGEGRTSLLIPHGKSSYASYLGELRGYADRHRDDQELFEALEWLMDSIRRMNVKEDWSVVRYVGHEYDGDVPGLGLTRGRCYYWPCSRENPTYEGVIDDEEFTSYLYPCDPGSWEVVLDPTGMAARALAGEADTIEGWYPELAQKEGTIFAEFAAMGVMPKQSAKTALLGDGEEDDGWSASEADPVTIPCPGCGSEFEHHAWTLVNARRDPELAARDLKRMLAYQYSSGYAPRNVLGGSINDKNFADCCVGIPMAAHSIAMELGIESGFLDEEVPFNDGTKASVYEHCRRAMDFLWNFRGLHGLIRIWGGDWNDCMDTVGLQGRGASVWLSMAWCYANRLFGRLAEATGRAEDAALSRERGREMADIINAAAWDGGHYLCAYKDDGTKLGSDENEEGRVFLIQQLWSILSGVVTPERLPKVLHAIDVDLYDPMGTLVMAPGYSRIDNTIGYIGTKAPGIHENGGIYLHTLAWKLAAEAVLKRNDKLYETLQQMLPVRDDGTSRPSEPYMISNSIFGPQTGYRYGTPGQSWRTASAQWLLKSLVNFIFGLKPAPDGLHLEPCLPAQWPECGIVKRFRGTTYDITFRHEPGRACNRVASVLVDGAPCDPAAALPLRPGATLRVEVTLA